MAARRQTVANPLAGLVGEAVLSLLQGTLSPNEEKGKREFKGARPGMRAVAVISDTEIGGLVKAAKAGESVEVTDPNGRTSYIERLADEDATKFKGRFRIHRALAPKA